MIDRYERFSLPTTLNEAANLLISDLTPQEIAAMDEMSNAEFEMLCDQLVPYLQDDFRIWSGNDRLLVSCFEAENADTSTDPMRIILQRVRDLVQSNDDVIIVT